MEGHAESEVVADEFVFEEGGGPLNKIRTLGTNMYRMNHNLMIGTNEYLSSWSTTLSSHVSEVVRKFRKCRRSFQEPN